MFQEDKENSSSVINQQKVDENKQTTHQYVSKSYSDNTILEHRSTPEWKQVSDASFEAMERMCDKTASDPNSTLFHYLHDIEDVKISVSERGSLEEIKCMKQLFGQLQVGNHQIQLENESPLKDVNVTNLEDIEAPSRLWENTITGDTILQTSPVKMVGLLRPSTIIEECIDVSMKSNSTSTSQMSFESALKGAPSEVSSSCYESAHDFDAHNYNNTKNHTTEELKDANINENLINLDETLAIANTSQKSIQLRELKADGNSILDFQTDNEDGEVDQCNTQSESIIEILSDDDSEINIDNSAGTFTARKATLSPIKNEPNSSIHKNDVEIQNKSLNFNDTMEEVEYMMKKGMEYMAAENAKKVETLSLPTKPTKEKAGISFAKPKTPVKRYAVDIPVIPKLDVFNNGPHSAIPTSANMRHNKQFQYVVSPVGTYMKKTATTPLISELKAKNKSVFNSTALRELERESRLYKPKFGATSSSTNPKAVQCSMKSTESAVRRNLPKKAYISSHFKHVVDERTPITIPGGKKIQKYLESAMLPAVVRHDGKITLPQEGMNSHIPRRTETSLANLSVMSGNVSMYTIKDAQKF